MSKVDALALLILMITLVAAAGGFPIRRYIARMNERDEARRRNQAHPWKY